MSDLIAGGRSTPCMANRLAFAMLMVYFGLSAIGNGLLVLRGVVRAPIVGMPITALIWEDAVVGMLSIAAATALWRRSATGWWLAVVLVATTIARRAPEFLPPWEEGVHRPEIVVLLRALILIATLLALALLVGRRRDFLPQQDEDT